MENSFPMLYLIALLTLHTSCVNPKPGEQEVNTLASVNTPTTDTLTFTSGIRAIFQDSKGHYWFGSHQEGVCRYDGTTFQYFTTNEGLADNQVRSIQEDQHGVIWFGTHNGVSSFDGQSIKTHPFLPDTLSKEWMKTDTDLWFNAGPREGVYRYDGQHMHYLAFPSQNPTTNGNVFAVTSFAKGRNQMLWIGTYAGVFGYDGRQLTAINDESLGLTDDTYKLHVRSIFEDSKGRLWIGNNGIGLLLKEGNSITHFSKMHGAVPSPDALEIIAPTWPAANSSGPLAVFAIAEDRDGNIWFGDRDSGAWKYDGSTLHNHPVDAKLSTPMVWSIYKDHSNHLLLGMAAGGVYQFNGQSFERRF